MLGSTTVRTVFVSAGKREIMQRKVRFLSASTGQGIWKSCEVRSAPALAPLSHHARSYSDKDHI
jgi:hypothetical protein